MTSNDGTSSPPPANSVPTLRSDGTPSRPATNLVPKQHKISPAHTRTPLTAMTPMTATSRVRPQLKTHPHLHPTWSQSTTPLRQTKIPSPAKNDFPSISPSPILTPVPNLSSDTMKKVSRRGKKIPLWPCSTRLQVLALQLRDGASTTPSYQNTAAMDPPTNTTTQPTVGSVACYATSKTP